MADTNYAAVKVKTCICKQYIFWLKSQFWNKIRSPVALFYTEKLAK